MSTEASRAASSYFALGQGQPSIAYKRWYYGGIAYTIIWATPAPPRVLLPTKAWPFTPASR